MANNPPVRDSLTEEDQKYISDNYQKQSVFSMAMFLGIKTEKRTCPIIQRYIESAGLKPNASAPVTVALSTEVKTVEDTAKIIVDEAPQVVLTDETDIVETVSIDQFAQNLRDIGVQLHDPPSEKEKREMRFVIQQLSASRYVAIRKTWRKVEYRDLFREEFIKSIFGKGDMPQEEINDFIDMVTETVSQYDLRCKMRELEKTKDDKNATIQHKMAITQMILEMQERYDKSVNRVGEIKKSLGATREKRIRDNRPTGMTVTALIEAFIDVEKRDHLVRLQDKRDKEMGECIDSIDAMEDAKALVLGVSREELMSGAL